MCLCNIFKPYKNTSEPTFTVEEMNREQLDLLKEKYAFEIVHNPPLYPKAHISDDEVKRVYNGKRFSNKGEMVLCQRK